MRIEASAVKFPNGAVFTGKRHCDCFLAAKRAGVKSPRHDEQGFITDTGLFVSREMAAVIAKGAGQIKELKYDSKRLFSEDLW